MASQTLQKYKETFKGKVQALNKTEEEIKKELDKKIKQIKGGYVSEIKTPPIEYKPYKGVSLKDLNLKQEFAEGYLERGYTTEEANILAEESVKRKQTFTPEAEQRIIREKTNILDRLKYAYQRGRGAISGLPEKYGKEYGLIEAVPAGVMGALPVTTREFYESKIQPQIQKAYQTSPIYGRHYDIPTETKLVSGTGEEIGTYTSPQPTYASIFAETLPMAFLTTPSAIIKQPFTARGYAKQEARIQLSELGEQDINWISIQDKGIGKIDLKGQQKYKNLQRDFSVSGQIKKTETGKTFVPEARGGSVISGKVTVGGKDFNILGGEAFKAGAKSGSKYIGDIQDFQVFKTISDTTTIPQVQTYGLYKKGGFFDRLRYKRQLKKNVPLWKDDVSKEFSFGYTAKVPKPEGGFTEEYLSLMPKSTGVSLVKDTSPSSVKIIKPANIEKTPLSRTFGATETKTIPSDIKISPPKLEPKTTPPISKTQIITGATGLKGTEKLADYGKSGVLPRMDSGLDIKSDTDIISDFTRGFRKGISEETRKGISEETQAKKGTTKKEEEETKDLILEDLGERTKGAEKQIPSTKIAPREAQRFVEPQLSVPRFEAIEIPKEVQKERVLLSTKTGFQTKQVTKQKQIQQPIIQPQPQPQPPPPKPPKPKPKPLDLEERTPKKKEKGDLLKKEFEVYGRRYGKDVSIGEFETKKKAKRAFIEFAKGTLGRSGYIKKSGEKIPFEKLNFGREFRPSKKSRTRLVQKAKYSLGTPSEVREIKSARRKASSKIKWV